MSDIPCPLAETAEIHGTEPGLVSDSGVITYREYESLVRRAAANLHEAGVKKGQRLAIVSGNSPDYAILLWAIWRLRAVAVLVNTRFPQTVITSLLRRVGCHALLCPGAAPADSSTHEYRAITIDCLGGRDDASINDAPEMGSIDPEGDATIVFTSGSSAEPKAVLHTFANHYFSALGSNENIAVAPQDRWLVSLPLYHVGGLAILFRTVLGSGAAVLARGDGNLAEAIERYHITHLSLVPVQLRCLLDQGLSPSSRDRLKAVLVGGSSIPRSLVDKAQGQGLPLFTTYGLTEMASQVTTTPPRAAADILHTSGRLLPFREMKLDGNREILVRGKTLCKGYVDGGHLAKLRDGEGWFRSGDTGTLDSSGYLTVTGRLDNMFIAGGENIHPEEIEDLLCLLPQVREAVVVPAPDNEFGSRPVAFILAERGAKLSKQDLVAHLERFLPHFKVPKEFYRWPVVAAGKGLKPDRHQLRKLVGEGTPESLN